MSQEQNRGPRIFWLSRQEVFFQEANWREGFVHTIDSTRGSLSDLQVSFAILRVQSKSFDETWNPSFSRQYDVGMHCR